MSNLCYMFLVTIVTTDLLMYILVNRKLVELQKVVNNQATLIKQLREKR